MASILAGFPSVPKSEPVQEPGRAEGASANLAAGSLRVAKQCVTCKAPREPAPRHRRGISIAESTRVAQQPGRSVLDAYVRTGKRFAPLSGAVDAQLLSLGEASAAATQQGAIHGRADRLGPVYPIIERDWTTWLPAQLQRRLRQRPLTISRDQVRASLRRQAPVLDLPEVKTPRTYVVDPSVRVSHPGTDPLGRVFAAGETLNPMAYLAGFRPILMIDGRSDRQIQWARGALKTTNAIVLTLAGDVYALVTRLGVPVYPAPPLLLERLSITRAPVIVSQSDGLVRVEEVVP